MNLLFTLTSYPPAMGGAQYLMHQLACELSKRNSVLVSAQWNMNRTDWLVGTTLNAPREPYNYVQDGIAVQCITLSSAARRQLAPWVYGYYAFQGAAIQRIAAALAMEMRPLAASADLIHNCRIGREGLSYASLRLARDRDIPFVFTPVHHPRWGGWLHRHYQALYRQADAVIALTNEEKRLLTRLGVQEQRIFVTGMGPVLAPTSEPDRFRRQYALGEGPLILFLGQKYAYKGIALVLTAAATVWSRYPEAKFVFIGPRTRYSREIFKHASDGRIRELDAVDLQTKTDAIAACSILCMPSTQESFGGVYTEAWSLGKPVIGARIPAVQEVISDGQDGLVVEPEPGAIADSLLQLLNQPSLAAQMGQRGREKVASRYGWARLAQLTELAYQQVLG